MFEKGMIVRIKRGISAGIEATLIRVNENRGVFLYNGMIFTPRLDNLEIVGTSEMEFEVPLLDFSRRVVIACPHCIDSSGWICIGGGHVPIEDPHTGAWVGTEFVADYDRCRHCYGDGRLVLVEGLGND